MLAKISPVIGNVNNFDIFTDNKNNAQIIDINLVSKDPPEKIYEDAFPLQLHNLNSAVRSYKLESKIFPEQSTIVAIGAQVEGGALGIDTTTFVAFNRSIRDRIIPVKSSPPDKLAESNTAKEKLDALLSNLETLYLFFGRLKPGFIADADFDVDKAGNYQNALKDLINYLRAITTSKTSNKAILPTVLSVVMDGIGGLIIGNLFKTNTDILPKGYKGSGQGGIGPNVGYLITGIGHTVGSGDWTTSIDAQTINLDSPKAEITDFDYSNITINVNATKEKDVVTDNNKATETKTPIAGGRKNTGVGSVAEDSQKYPVLVKSEKFKSAYNSTVQKYAKVSTSTPIAESLRKQLDKSYITEKGVELASNGDITDALKSAILTFQSKLKSTAGFEFIKKKPIRITAGNDSYHRTYGDKRNRTTHSRGLAIDIGTREYDKNEIDSIMNLLRSSGFTYTIYHGGSALHIHTNISTT
jgi:hypothetical protein